MKVQQPDPFLAEALQRLDAPAGARALDLACGRGRHALELARCGFEVEAWDRDAEALAELEAHAHEEGLTLRIRQLDCEQPPLAGPFDLVVVFNYLDRSLPARIAPSVRSGGALILCTFTTEREGEHPSERWCLQPGELARGFEGWTVAHSYESGGRAGILAHLERGGSQAPDASEVR